MAERVQIEIEATDAASGVLRAITSQFGALGAAGSDLVNMFSANKNALSLYNRALKDSSVSINDLEAAESAASAATGRFYEALAMLVINGLKESINATMEYSASVRDLSLASGASAEESSRLIQVLDDYEITASDITTATRNLTKNGFEPNMETIANLADEYVKLQSPLERNQFIMENFGRGGGKWANALSQGGDALRNLSDNVNENLILNEKNQKATEDYRLALDGLKESYEGFSIQIGTRVIPMLTQLMDAMAKNTEQYKKDKEEMSGFAFFMAYPISAMLEWATATESSVDELDSAGRSYYAMGLAAETAIPAIENNADAVSQAITPYSEIVSMAERLNDATAEQIRLAAYQDLKAKLKESGGEITDEEAKVLEAAGLALGVLDQKSIYAAKSIENLNKQFLDGKIKADEYYDSLNTLADQVGKMDGLEANMTVNTTYNTSGDSGTTKNNAWDDDSATGTSSQWKTVPPGYPNDTFGLGLSSGERYMVQTASSAGGDTVNNSNAVNNYYGNNTFVLQGSGGEDIGGVRI